MTLTLTIRNVSSLDNGMPTEFVLHRRGGVIGRAPTCDWALPDPHRYISSRHCEINFRDDSYFLADVSTNGTFINGGTERMPGEKRLVPGDIITIGHYEVVAELSGAAAALLEPAPPPPSENVGGWDSWSKGGANTPPAVPASGGWDSPAPAPPMGGGGWDNPAPAAPAASSNAPGWGAAPPSAAPATSDQFQWGSSPLPESAPTGGGGWGPSHNVVPPSAAADSSAWTAPEPAPAPASGWSSAAPDRPAAPSTDDIWGKIAEGNVVDWARGGFGSASSPAPADPLGLQRDSSAAAAFGAAPAPPAATSSAPSRIAPTPVTPRVPSSAAAAPPASAGADLQQLYAQFLAATGVDPSRVKGTPPEVIQRGAGLLRRLVAGLVVLVEARARAKSQMGAESTKLELNGNNPIKFARSPEQALAQLLSAPERGFMDSERAIEDSFFDLQSHQMATLKAMQGALRATLDRFSPDAIRKRVGDDSLLKKLLPAARDAALWQSYEKEFGGVARGSDEAFMDVFAKEFRKAYEEANQRR